jgi:hypothetical protein
MHTLQNERISPFPIAVDARCQRSVYNMFAAAFCLLRARIKPAERSALSLLRPQQAVCGGKQVRCTITAAALAASAAPQP